MSILCVVDDKYIPLYRVVWVAKTPHYCGNEDCEREGAYEIRLEGDESVWASEPDRDKMLDSLERWQGGLAGPHDDEDWEHE